MQHYIIERMTPREVNLAIDWAKQEEWNPGLNDGYCFYQTDPQGFFAGKLKGKIIAVGSAVAYDEQFAFFGLYIVDKAYRQQGYGLKLTHHCLNYMGNRNVGLDGVLAMLTKYEHLGFQLAHKNTRYHFTNLFPKDCANLSVIPLQQVSFELLTQFDRQHFPSSRNTFLQCWINQTNAVSLGFLEKEKLRGYGVIRACQSGYKIGPLFAQTPEIAEALFLQLIRHANKSIYLDIPENNQFALELVKKYKGNQVFSTGRMYLKEEPPITYQQIYGITSFELG
ncbi:acetyltransferase, GNAT family [Legionella beliardensis]|uniref:Acetyltransferase, GNAT family n=2 Tax=Legionella beliardensis TaxID=91822 RepID=A0A378I460_9GAMM|nr:acetyltransferase, GNAT family [Legionella beliardensis]